MTARDLQIATATLNVKDAALLICWRTQLDEMISENKQLKCKNRGCQIFLGK
jgi:hypothetical protein